jgi:drug/metabolite transporter (DMT)-like permease
MEYVGPFAFNGIRFILGSLSLFPLVAFRKNRNSEHGRIIKVIPGALIAGTCLFIAVTLQQIGIIFTTAGNAGFITGLYVVLTPVFGIFLGRKTGPITWVGTVFTFTGLYFISAAGHLDINRGDVIIALGAIFWAFHVLLIDRLVQKKDPVDPIVLSSGQFGVCGLFSLIAAFLVEPFLALGLESYVLFEWRPFPALLKGLITGIIPIELVSGAMIPILFGGLGSVGIAYTLQVVAQRDAPPAHATIILCLEGCFAALGGIIILHEPRGTWTLLGFALMLMGMLISQWEIIAKSPGT